VLQDRKATLDLFQAPFRKLDWRLFDPVNLGWQFDAERYLNSLQGLKSS